MTDDMMHPQTLVEKTSGARSDVSTGANRHLVSLLDQLGHKTSRY